MTERKKDIDEVKTAQDLLKQEEERHTITLERDNIALISKKFKETHKWLEVMQRRTDPTHSVHIDASSHPDSRASMIKEKLAYALEDTKKNDLPSASLELSGMDIDLITVLIVPYTTRRQAETQLKHLIKTSGFLFPEEVHAAVSKRTNDREHAALALHTAWVQAGGVPRETFLKRSALFAKKP